MKYRRVIIVRDSPYNYWEENQFGVNELQSSGLHVELWNVGPIFQPLGSQETVDPPRLVTPRQYYHLNDFGDACGELSAHDLLIFMCGYSPSRLRSHLRMWQIASNSVASLSVVVQGGMPRLKSIFRVENFNVFTRKILGLQYWIVAQFTYSPRGRIFRNALRKILRLRALDYIWAGTTVSSVDPVLISERTKITYIHNFDFDSILDIDSSLSKPRNVALYIDHMGYNHPDFFSLGYASLPRDDSEFFSSLESAFKEIEEEYGLTVEIAAHPRAAKGSLVNCYPNRVIHHDRTITESSSAKLVLLTSASTVVGAAAAFEVPMMGLTSRSFLKDFEAEIRLISQELDFPVQEIDRKNCDWPEVRVNTNAYQKYVNSFLKLPNTSQQKFWQQVLGQIS